jgi:hypothetical protein
VPDGEATPEAQINTEVAFDQTLHTLARVIGVNFEAQAGGGNVNGNWVFTDLNELDELIRQWSDIRQSLYTRAGKIRRVAATVQPPAEDMMSVRQAQAFTNSLQAMQQHAQEMSAYAGAYLQKLEQARTGYAIAEQDNAARFH